MSFPYINNTVYNPSPVSSPTDKKLSGEVTRHTTAFDNQLQNSQVSYQYHTFSSNLAQPIQLYAPQYSNMKPNETIDSIRQPSVPLAQSMQDSTYSGARLLNGLSQALPQTFKPPLIPNYSVSQYQNQPQYANPPTIPQRNQRGAYYHANRNTNQYHNDQSFPKHAHINEQMVQPIISQHYHSNDGYGHSFIYEPINDLDSIVGSLHPIVENPRTFKPPKPKENTRPRINKLTTPQENSTRLFKHPITDIGEYSIDKLKQLFLNHLHMIEPTNKLSSFSSNLKNEIEYQMFNYFVNNLSSQLDVFFEVKVYSEIVSQMALYDDSGILLQSVFCLSSLMLHRMMPDKIDASLPIKYYHHSIKTIKSYLDMFNHDMGVCSKCLLATTLLSVYEFYFTSIEDIYTGNAVSILASIIQSDNSRNKSSPLLDSVFLETCFWSVFTLGFIQSLKNVRVNIYSVDLFWKALDSEYFTVFDKYLVLTEASEPKTTLSKTETVWWFRKTILICSQISDFKGEVNVPTQQDVEQNQIFKKWIELKDILIDFENKAPTSLFPVIYHSNSDSGAFPTIFFKDELSTLIGINRALAKLLLFESLLVKTNTQAREVRDELSKFPPGYEKKLAKDLIGIIKCYDSNSAIWPLNLHVLGHVQAYLADEEQAINEMSPLITKLSKVCNLNI